MPKSIMKMARLSIPSLVSVLLATTVQAQYFPVTGIQTGIDAQTGARPARQNINDLQNDVYGWALYIQGLEAFQAVSQLESLSYYQVAGIHGLPFQPWDDVYGPNGYSQATGYCTHDSILFATWHRPYVALYEQLLHQYVTDIAAEYNGSDAANWQAAAQTWRIPYWDWALDPDIPSIMSQKTISIQTPTGQKTINNPTYMYTFHPLNNTDFPLSDGTLSKGKTTVRSSRANQVLENVGLQSGTYNLFTHVTDFSSFSTQATSGNSLESIHSYVHSAIGANTANYHMSVIPFSAMDPIFMLHHAQVDRIFALWGAIYNDQRIPASGLENEYGTFTIAPGTIDYTTSPLTPFMLDSTGTPWTSDQAYNTVSLGYTYDPIEDWNNTASEISQTVTEYVQSLYGSSNGASKRWLKFSKQNPKRYRFSDIVPLREWFVFAEVAKFALKGSFTVYIFLGSPPSNEHDWPVAPNLVGALAVLVSNSGAHANMMMSGKGPITHGEWVLGDKLSAYGVDPSDVTGVVNFLTSNLHWRVRTHDGITIDPAQVEGLLISVTDEIIIPSDDGKSFPTFGSSTDHPEITRGKPGGAE